MNIVSISNINKSYINFHLQDINIEIPKSAIMGLVGENGAGKTTLIKLLVNGASKDTGEIRIFGKDNIECETDIKKRLGIVFDSNYFCGDWTIKLCERAISGFYDNWSSTDFQNYLTRFKLVYSQKVKSLSRGNLMRLMLAASLSHGADLLILDEPTSGLDPMMRDELMDILKEYIRDSERSVLFSTHITSDLEKVASHISFLHQGKLIYCGLKAEMVNEYLGVNGNITQLKSHHRILLLSFMVNGDEFSGMILKKNRNQFDEFDFFELNIEDFMLFTKRGSENENSEINKA